MGQPALLFALLLGVARANYYCEQVINGHPVLHHFEGKMNVPIKPAVEPEKVLFLWPGLNPYAGEGGMMQPVLTNGADYGQGPGVWGMANWFTNCPKEISSSGYCHDPYQAVAEGDVIEFAMDYRETFANGTRRWDMSWRAVNGGQSSVFPVFWESKDVISIWSTEAEFYLDPTLPANHAKLPQSPAYTWALRATDDEGRDFPLMWSAHGSDARAITVDCNVTVAAGSTQFERAQVLAFADGGCSDGFSRSFNFGCQSYCGCTNPDGSPKISCDYCCKANSACHREKGPSVTRDAPQPANANNATTRGPRYLPPGVDASGTPLPVPGLAAEVRSRVAEKSAHATA
jgi:hypothetical protein